MEPKRQLVVVQLVLSVEQPTQELAEWAVCTGLLPWLTALADGEAEELKRRWRIDMLKIEKRGPELKVLWQCDPEEVPPALYVGPVPGGRNAARRVAEELLYGSDRRGDRQKVTKDDAPRG